MSSIEDILRAEEGEVAWVYPDSLGYWTIGVGILVDKRKGGGLRPEEITFILRNRIELMKAAVLKALPWAAQLSTARQAVLVCMAFQLGLPGLLEFHGMLAAAMIGDFNKAGAEMLDSKWARSDSPARAIRMKKMFVEGAWPST